MKIYAKKVAAALAFAALLPGAACSTDSQDNNHEETLRIAEEAYIYALPLVIMDLTRQTGIHVFELEGGNLYGAPANQFFHMRWISTANDRQVVRPNVDTLYSTAWLNLNHEPIIFSKPETDFYASIAVLDAYTNCYNTLGTGGLGGNDAAVYALCGPDYAGEIPAGSIRVDIPTNMGWVICRLQYDDNFAALHEKQDEFLLIPLSDYGNPGFVPPSVTVHKEALFEPFAKVNGMDIETFFNVFNELSLTNPGTEADKPALERFAPIGVGPGLVFALDSFPPEIGQALRDLPAPIIERLGEFFNGRAVNGWEFPNNSIARFGTDYEFRASIALTGLGANPVDMAVYPSAKVGSDGLPLDGSNDYVIHFEAGQFPPNGAFWSITVYDDDGFLVPNTANKYAIRGSDSFATNPDGSVSIYLQREAPEDDLRVNWLPIPQDLFRLTMRIYLPHQAVLDGEWLPPQVEIRS